MHAAWIIALQACTIQSGNSFTFKTIFWYVPERKTEAAYDIATAVINNVLFVNKTTKRRRRRQKKTSTSQTWKSHTIIEFNYLRLPNHRRCHESCYIKNYLQRIYVKPRLMLPFNIFSRKQQKETSGVANLNDYFCHFFFARPMSTFNFFFQPLSKSPQTKVKVKLFFFKLCVRKNFCYL